MIMDSVELVMEVDTGASVSMISEETCDNLRPNGKKPSLLQSDVTLLIYSGEQLAIKGILWVDVQYKDQNAQLQLVVATGKGPSLLGETYFQEFAWTGLNCVITMHVILSPCRTS